MILTCDSKMINIDFGIVIIEVSIQPIRTNIFLVICTTITPTLFFYVICYLIWINECDDALIKFFNKIPTDSSITIVITTCIGRLFFTLTKQFLFI